MVIELSSVLTDAVDVARWQSTALKNLTLLDFKTDNGISENATLRTSCTAAH